ncbi:thermonuclease [bacterium]|nr:MAG: thermonuclease [bacterium]
MKKILKWVLIAVTAVCGAVVYFQPAGMEWPLQKAEMAQIVKVVDGDTFEIQYLGKIEKVRLIGIDTPEAHANAKAVKDAARTGADIHVLVEQGNDAKNFVKQFVPGGTQVRVEVDVNDRDKYGRLLAYLFFEDGRMINEEIVKAGYANLMTYPPNVRYKERFLSAYRFARENKKGLWKEDK